MIGRVQTPAIVMLRGTGGSGKTTAAYTLMNRLAGEPRVMKRHFPAAGKQVHLGSVWEDHGIAVLGRYDTACGGCDGYSWRGAAENLEAEAMDLFRQGISVFFEGLIVTSWGYDRVLRMVAETNRKAFVVQMNTPLDVCIESIRDRREQAGKPREFNVENTKKKFYSAEMGFARLAAAGAPRLRVERENVVKAVADLLTRTDFQCGVEDLSMRLTKGTEPLMSVITGKRNN